MAVANAWATGRTTVPMAQLRPHRHPSSSSSECSIVAGKSLISFPRRAAVFLRNRKSSKPYCHCSATANSSNSNNDTSSASDWDWNRWTRHFSEIERAESFASLLKFQLEEAVEKEDFQEAAKLKTAIAETTPQDSIAEIMSLLKGAVDEERYLDASRLCRSTGSGLVGWWVGYSKDSDDPFGRLIRITPGMGRFVARSYSPRQLVSASPGSPLFELFVVKDAEGMYTMQVVFLQQDKGNTTNTPSLSISRPTRGPSTTEIENASEVDIKVNEDKSGKGDEKDINVEVTTEEGIKSVIKFLKDKIPELKVRVLNVNVTEEAKKDSDAEQWMEEDDENKMSSENFGDEAGSLDDTQPDRVSLGGGSDTMEDGKNLDTKLFIGGVLHNKEDTLSKEVCVRVPAEIKDMERDSFLLHIPKRNQKHDTEESTVAKFKVAVLAAQGVSELMPPDVAKAFWGSDKISSKVSGDVREIVKLAVTEAQKRDRLSEYTSFSRITTSKGDLDPFDGLYVGAFGPYGTEVVQLRRRYGNWNCVSDAEKSSEVDFFEFVEAVKLTGDLNVPAGQVTFRAKIGKGSRLTNRGMYPDELGVVASYKGQGRIAEFGFCNPKWVEGELLQFNGKGMGPYIRGADFGFLYVVPEQSFLVLFSRLKLPD